jgi:hypothetical protein
MTIREQKKRELARVVTRLNQISDQLTETIEGEEDELAKIGVGLPVWLDERPFGRTTTEILQSDGSLVPIEEHWRLGYLKLGGRWHIVTKHMEWVCGGDWNEVQAPVPLAKAPRHIRAEALPYLDSLVDCLIKAASKYCEDIEATLSKSQSSDEVNAESKNGRGKREVGRA